jgi:predicted MFS family arabinose efflux permease
VLLLGALSLAIGAAGSGFTQSIPVLFLLRILQAAGYVAFSTAAYSLVPGLIPQDRQGSALAIFGAGANLAIATVPSLINWALASLEARWAFHLAATLALLAGISMWLLVPGAAGKKRSFQLKRMVEFPRSLWMPMITAWCFGVGFGLHFQFLPLLAQRRDLDGVALAYAVYGAAIILTRLITGHLLDSRSRLEVLTYAILFMSAGLGAFALAQSKWALLGASALVAAGGGILHPGLITMHVEIVPERGQATAAFYLAFDLGIGLGAWLLSPVLKYLGIGAFFLSGALIALGSLIPFRQIPDRRRAELAACC